VKSCERMLRLVNTPRALSAAAATFVLTMALSAPASAFEGGGRKPSEAPLITIGQHYTGQLNNHRDDANYGGFHEVAFWHLPPITTRDVIVVDWHAVPYTESPGSSPICLSFAQGIDDFNWGSVFERATCGKPSGSDSARTEIVAQEANSTSSYLEFADYADETNPARYETYPYDFTIEPILHYLSVAMRPVKRVSANGIVYATANLANGLPAPDGLTFNLTATWQEGGIATFTGTSSGGVIGFQLALPETVFGKNADFTVSHPADGTYQGVSAPKLRIKVAKPKPPGPTPCSLAEKRELALARQLKRLKHHAAHAHGATRAFLHHRVRQTRNKLRKARRKTASLCG
jgi:hypothetical protein